jgi:Protein of unknown function (DUF2975)
MRQETELKLDRIKRISSRLRTVCKCLLVLTAILFVVAAAGILVGSGVTIRSFDLVFPVSTLALPGRLGLIALLGLSLGVIAKALYHLDQLFGDYARGEIFTTRTAGHIRRLGITAILWTGVNMIWLVAALILLPSPAPTTFQFHLDALLIGVVVIVISWFMDAAAEMREENDLTI